jgi:hypothetical protein
MRSIVGASLLAVLLGTTALADTSSMSTTTTGMGVLENDYVKAGVNGDKGTFGSGGNTSPGLLFDSTGSGTFNTSYDYLTPGSPFDGFSVKVDGTNYTNNNSGASGITGDGNGLTDGDGTLSWTGGVTSVFDLTNTYSLGTDAPYVDISTEITMGTAADDVYFGRFIDPDARAATGDSSSTDNVLGYGAIPDSNVAFSEALSSRYALGLYSTDSNVDAGITGWTTDADSYTHNRIDGEDDNTNTGDNTIGLTWHWEDVAAGDILEANYAYIFGPSAFDAAEDAVNGGAGGGADILTGDLEDVGSATDAADTSGPTVVGSASSSVTNHSSSTSEGVQTITRTKRTSTWDVYSDGSTGTSVDTEETLDPFTGRMDQVEAMTGLNVHRSMGIPQGVSGGRISHDMGNGYSAETDAYGIGHTVATDTGMSIGGGISRASTALTGDASTGEMNTMVVQGRVGKALDNRDATIIVGGHVANSDINYSRTIGDFSAEGETSSSDVGATVTVEKSTGTMRPFAGVTVGKRSTDGWAETGDVQAMLLATDEEETYRYGTLGFNIDTGVLNFTVSKDFGDSEAMRFGAGINKHINERVSFGASVNRLTENENTSTYMSAGIRIRF